MGHEQNIDENVSNCEKTSEDINHTAADLSERIRSRLKRMNIEAAALVVLTIVLYFIWGSRWFVWFSFAVASIMVLILMYIYFHLGKIENIKNRQLDYPPLDEISEEELTDKDDVQEGFNEEVDHAFVTKKYQEMMEQLQKHAKSYIAITPTRKRPKDIRASKFGGRPYWIKGIEYPTDKEGRPLYMIAQLNFEEIPHLDGYPTEGILQFFIADDDVWGIDFDSSIEEILKKPYGYRVVYHAAIEGDQSDRLEFNVPDIATTDSAMPFNTEYGLVFEKKRELPSLHDCMFREVAGDIGALGCNDETTNALIDILDEKINNDGSKLGGYAVFTQEDPRYLNGCKEWQLLFQLDTYDEDGIDIMWGDGGVANFFIEPHMLKKRDFSHVWYNWDCY